MTSKSKLNTPILYLIVMLLTSLSVFAIDLGVEDLPNTQSFNHALIKYETPYNLTNIKTRLFPDGLDEDRNNPFLEVTFDVNIDAYNGTPPSGVKLRLQSDNTVLRLYNSSFLKNVSSNWTDENPTITDENAARGWWEVVVGLFQGSQFTANYQIGLSSVNSGDKYKATVMLEFGSLNGASFIMKFGQNSTTYNFTFSNGLGNNSVKDVYIYNITTDTVSFSEWYTGNGTGVANKGAIFDGYNDDVSYELNLSGQDNVTVEGWFKINSYTTDSGVNTWQSIVDTFFSSTGKSNLRLYLYDTTNYVSCWWYNEAATESNILQSSYAPDVGRWYHYACRKNSTDVALWVDGVLVESAAFTGLLRDTGDNHTYLGMEEDDQWDMNGEQDELHVYFRDLSEAEIVNSFNKGSQRLKSDNSNADLELSLGFDSSLDDESVNLFTPIVTGDTKVNIASWWREGNDTRVDSSMYDGSIGSNNGLDIQGDVLGVTNVASFMCWIKPKFVNTFQIITALENNGIVFAIDQNEASPNKLCLYLGLSAETGWVCSTGDLQAGNWSLVTGTYNSTEKRVYINNNLEGAQAETGNVYSIGPNTGGIGVAADDNADFDYEGLFDECYIFNRSLSHAEINATYDLGIQHLKSNVSSTQLRGYWSFDHDASYVGNADLNTSFQNSARITGRSSAVNFPLKAALVLTESSLDIFEIPSNISQSKLWMRFFEDTNNALPATNQNSVIAKEGNIFVGNDLGLNEFNLFSDVLRRTSSTGREAYLGNTFNRNNVLTYTSISGEGIVNSTVNDVDVVDGYSLLCTGGGVSFINLSNRNVSSDGGDACYAAEIYNNDLLYSDNKSLARKTGYPSTDFTPTVTELIGAEPNAIRSDGTELFLAMPHGGVLSIDSSNFLFNESKSYVTSSYDTSLPFLWSKMGSADEIVNATIRPVGGNGSFFGPQPEYVPGLFGNASRFESSLSQSIYFNLSSVPIIYGNDSLALSIWMIMEDTSTSPCVIFEAHNPQTFSAYQSWRISKEIDEAHIGLTDINDYDVDSYARPIDWEFGKWIHLEFLMDRTNVTLFKNNEVIFSWLLRLENDPQNINQTQMPYMFYFGNRDQGNGNLGCDIVLDDIKVYNTTKRDFADRFKENNTQVTPMFSGNSNDAVDLELLNERFFVGLKGFGVNAINKNLDVLNASFSSELVSQQVTSLSVGSILVGTEEGASLIPDEEIPIPPVIIMCGSYVNNNFTMTNHLTNSTGGFSCSDTGLFVNASNIVIDCSDFDINYSAVSTGIGIDVTAVDNDDVTVKNCNLNQISTSTDSHGVSFGVTALRGIVINSTILTTGADSHGLSLQASSNNSLIDGNNIHTSSAGSSGVFFFGSSQDRVINNNISTNGSNDAHGVFFFSSPNSSVINNQILTSGISDPNHGVFLFISPNGLITNNTISVDSSASNTLRIASSSSATVLTNILSTNNTDATNIRLASSENSSITSNSISTYGFGLSHGLFVGGSHRSTISNNNISLNGPDDGVGIFLQSTNSHIITNNTITTLGNTDAHGINLAISSSSNNLINNRILSVNGDEIRDTTGAGTFNFLVYNNSFSSINWINSSSGGFLDDLDVDATGGIGFGFNLNVSQNYAGINTSAFTLLGINSTANITLRNLNLNSLFNVYEDTNFDGVFDEICTRCTNINYTGTTLRFETTGFSGYGAFNGTNDPPELNFVNQTTAEDTPFSLNLSQFTTDNDSIVPDDITWTVLSENTNQADCSIFGANLTVNPFLNYFGNANCTVRASDGIDFDDDILFINITPVNDPPFLFFPNWTMSTSTTRILELMDYTIDVDNVVPTEIMWNITAENPSELDCNIVGLQLYLNAQSIETLASCTINVTDNMDYTMQTFYVNITTPILNITDTGSGFDFTTLMWTGPGCPLP